MKKSVLSLVVAAAGAALSCIADAQERVAPAAPRKVALVVQNHTSDAPTLPMSAFADTLSSRLSGEMFRVVNPHNVIGVDQNRTAKGEEMPEMSAKELASSLGADGVITASIQEFSSEDVGVPAIAHQLKVRIAMNLVDAATGETVCGVDGVEFSKNYTAEKVKADTATLYEGLLHVAAAKAAERLVAKASAAGWEKSAANALRVFFGCNVLGADIQVDGLSYGTCPAELTLTPGVHNVTVSYPPYYQEFSRRAMFNQEGQMYKVVLQITPEGERFRERAIEYDRKILDLNNIKRDRDFEYEKKKRLLDIEISERCGLFKKQLDLADAMLDRYMMSGEADDYVRKTIAEGTAVYWKNSFGRIAITDGFTDNIQFATPVTRTSDISVPPRPDDIAQGLKALLMNGAGR